MTAALIVLLVAILFASVFAVDVTIDVIELADSGERKPSELDVG